jgi:hypothetical protein
MKRYRKTIGECVELIVQETLAFVFWILPALFS